MKYLLENQETERLHFRLLEENDSSVWIKLFENPLVPAFLGMGELKTPAECCKKWFDKVYDRYNRDLGGMNVLINKSTGQLIGQCGLLVQEVDNNTELEIGYSILPQFWNMGYATEAAIKCRDHSFLNSFSDSLISIIHMRNAASEKVAQKNGMLKEKTTTFMEMPVNIFRITHENWNNLNINLQTFYHE